MDIDEAVIDCGRLWGKGTVQNQRGLDQWEAETNVEHRLLSTRRIAWGPNPQSLGPCRRTFFLLLIVEVFLARTLQASATIDLLSSCHTFKELGKVSNM